ncbi:hypothetical protein C6N75_24370 [Streptomyces solincola]|uniref:Type VII secretion protein EccE n=1 Tax=Streptomyces solincola TaxID=2100817 RepID=A0A2S9PQJ1_9ACTN|nr:hypothetical protein [Streptomyces solincola]PRH76663.1 hypothetical protein C6N75_24370 [Streptomyces solincola]
MYSLSPGYRVPALQRGLSPLERGLTKGVGLVGGGLMASAMITPPPFWTLGAVGAAAALVNWSPGPRSLGRWAAVGGRRLVERTAPAAMTRPARGSATSTWTLYPDHGTMQDPYRRTLWHEALGRALAFAGGQARTAGVQVHGAYQRTTTEDTHHAQTLSIHVPRGLVGQPDRLLETIAGEFAGLGALAPLEPEPAPQVSERGPGWVGLDTGRYAVTARITAWPQETDGDLMPRLLLGAAADWSLGVLYRPLPAGQSRRSAKWQSAAGEAFTTDTIKAATQSLASSGTQGALAAGAALVDLDAYLTVWADTPEEIAEARWRAHLAADRHRIRLDWLPGQQHRAYLMTTPHAACTRKGAVL